MRPRLLALLSLLVALLAAAAGAFFLTRPNPKPSPPLPDGPAAIVSAVTPASSTTAPGCAASTPRPEGESLTLASGRRFSVWGPASWSEKRLYPLVLAFHGYGSNGRAFQKWFQMEAHVEGAAFVVYPDADGANWDYRGDRDIAFVAELIERVTALWCVDRKHVMALGFSYGSRFVNHLGCAAPALVRAIVPAGGRWDPEESCRGPLPVLVVHRTNDPSMPISGSRDAAARWARIDGCSTETTALPQGCVAYRDCQAGAVSFCEDTHADPEWPAAWNHTMREPYRALAWQWFQALR